MEGGGREVPEGFFVSYLLSKVRHDDMKNGGLKEKDRMSG